MDVFARRAALSRQQRLVRVEAARHELTEFLAALDPLWRTSLLDQNSLKPQESLDVMRRRPAAVMFEYERLLVQIPDEWRRYCRHQLPQYKLLAEYRLLGRVRRRGAPNKEPDERECAMVAERVADAQQRLKAGCELRRQRKTAGGAASDDTAIRPELRALGYGEDECLAILRTKSPRGAAVFVVAHQLQKKPSSIRSSLRRARSEGASSGQRPPE